MAEFRAELHDPDRAEQEAGDLIFAVINVLRKLKINPEVALTRTCEKFIDRFRRMEDRAGARLTGMTPEEMDALWEDAKREETGN
jgi:tetrapyrrole methylase family protein/MazG family protein